ncbi:MAG TPA: siderophore-interacting protein [Polyangiaceae bacterium]
MSSKDLSGRPPTKGPGAFAKVLRRLLGKQGTVTAVVPIGDQFRLVTLEGPALKSVAWIPGQKLQVAMGSTFAARTYTPIDWDAQAGRTRILGYAHGDGPGSSWLRDLRPGDECDLFGPGASLDARSLPSQLAVFGDETSIGLACALASQDHGRPVRCYFEVDDVGRVEEVIATLGLGNVTCFGKQSGDAHLQQLEAALQSLAADGASFVLTGKASTIQGLKRSLKLRAVPASRVAARAYWAPGKTGLD